MAEPLIIAQSGDTELAMLPALANRHGCITGATGTGKTVTLQKMAESFSRIGVPVFMADVKGDLTGIAKAGQLSDKMKARLTEHKLPEPQWGACPVTLWDVWGEQGHPVRATISDMGPLVLSRLLNLNETQEGVLALRPGTRPFVLTRAGAGRLPQYRPRQTVIDAGTLLPIQPFRTNSAVVGLDFVY